MLWSCLWFLFKLNGKISCQWINVLLNTLGLVFRSDMIINKEISNQWKFRLKISLSLRLVYKKNDNTSWWYELWFLFYCFTNGILLVLLVDFAISTLSHPIHQFCRTIMISCPTWYKLFGCFKLLHLQFVEVV